MYPQEIFLGIGLYEIFIVVGIVACFAAYRISADKFGLSAKLQNFCLALAVAAIAIGYCSAVLAQGFYNIAKLGSFILDSNTGSTFLGGLIGGAGSFILIYFVGGHFLFGGKYHIRSFRAVSDCAACAIAVAHAFGRVGCLMGGCCYGRPTDSWCGIYMQGLDKKVVPIQLFEAIFLFALFAVLMVMVFKIGKYVMPTYMTAYGVWRFFIEYARGDERGSTIVDFLSPSQLTAILLILGGVLLFVIELKLDRRRGEGATGASE